MRCKYCVNSSGNPSRVFDKNGICNVCNEYNSRFSLSTLQKELEGLKKLIHSDGSMDCLAAVSGGKDSIAMLIDICDLGFHPLAFTFDVGYNIIDEGKYSVIKTATSILNIPHRLIDARKYFNSADIESLRLMADFYDNQISTIDDETVQRMFRDERFSNSPKSNDIRAFIRPCRLCRRPVIRGYYEEAIAHGVSVVFLGINEWCGIHNSNYSAIRKLEPVPNKPVYIVHLPFLLQKKYSSLTEQLCYLGWSRNTTLSIETGSKDCLLARIAESKASPKLGFNPDETRLAREVTCGFITRDQALAVINRPIRQSALMMKDVLIKSGFMEK